MKRIRRAARLLSDLIVPETPQRRRSALKAVWGATLLDRLDWGKGAIWPAWHPDSSYEHDLHPELHALRRAWLEGNRRNNGGDLGRFFALILNIKRSIADAIEGDFAELGVWRGNSAAVLAAFASRHGRRTFLFDTFAGFDDRDLQGADRKHPASFADTSLEQARRTVGAREGVIYVPGFFPESITEQAASARFAFVSLDCDLYAPMKAGLEFFYARMPPGGTLFVHDYSSGFWEGVARAVDEFCAATGERPVLLPDKSGSAVIRKCR